MYTNNLIMEFCNTCFTILRKKKKKKRQVYLNRLGSNPLEHTFGMIRMRSRDKDSWENLQKKVGHIQLLRRIKEELNISNDICGRIPEFGQVVSTHKITKSPFLSDSRDIAVCLHILFGNQMKSNYLRTPFWNEIFSSYKEVTDHFFMQLTSMFLQVHPVPDTVKLCSSHISVGNSYKIINRIIDNEILNSNRWSDKKDEDMLSLVDEEGLNFEEVGKQLGKTAKSIEKRYNRLKEKR